MSIIIGVCVRFSFIPLIVMVAVCVWLTSKIMSIMIRIGILKSRNVGKQCDDVRIVIVSRIWGILKIIFAARQHNVVQRFAIFAQCINIVSLNISQGLVDGKVMIHFERMLVDGVIFVFAHIEAACQIDAATIVT